MSLKAQINNDFYDLLGEGWYSLKNHPIALLRAENRARIPWIDKTIQNHFSKPCKILDIGCGAGMLTNFLSEKGHRVTGIDLSEKSLSVAEKFDTTNTVEYIHADANQLPFSEEQFDVVCAMDILEHVQTPHQLIRQASRVLKNNGLFFFHTFNKNLLSYLLIIKAVDWFVPHAPKNMHIYDLFISLKDIKKMCTEEHLKISSLRGFRLKFLQAPLFRMLFKREISDDFRFIFSRSLSTGYCGFAQKDQSAFL
jgi:2-polyprenyl-6-hydroxyphenyl methylase / 3-demethylubiquinone-9 3-methyltransferase